MSRGALLFVAALTLAPATASADDADLDPIESGRPFESGTFEMSGGLGVTLRSRPLVGFTFNPLPVFGYYMLRGLELGFQTDMAIDGKEAISMSFLPFIRYVLWRSYLASPYVVGQGGFRVMLGRGKPPGDPDVLRENEAMAGGGAGVVLFGNRRFGIQFQATVFGLFPTDQRELVCANYGCVEFNFGVTLSYLFGGFIKSGVRDPGPGPD